LVGKSATSMAEVLRESVNMSDVEKAMASAFAEVYDAELEVGMV